MLLSYGLEVGMRAFVEGMEKVLVGFTTMRAVISTGEAEALLGFLGIEGASGYGDMYVGVEGFELTNGAAPDI